MTVAENLLQLNETKQAIKTAIEEKGQDLTNVPFTEYASKIAGIVSGGVIGFIDSGTFTPTADERNASSVLINHNLGKVPDIVYFMMDEKSAETIGNSANYLYGGVQINLGIDSRFSGNAGTRYTEVILKNIDEDFVNVHIRSLGYSGASIFSDTQFCLWGYSVNANWVLKAGCTYHWYAIKLG